MTPLEYSVAGQMLSGYLGIGLMLVVFGVVFVASDEKFWRELYAEHSSGRKSYFGVHLGNEQDKTAKGM